MLQFDLKSRLVLFGTGYGYVHIGLIKIRLFGVVYVGRLNFYSDVASLQKYITGICYLERAKARAKGVHCSSPIPITVRNGRSVHFRSSVHGYICCTRDTSP